MAKLACLCGHIIRDQTDALSYKGNFIPDEDNEKIYAETANRIADFIHAIESGTKEAFLRQVFGESYPDDLDDLSIIWDLISYLDKFRRLIYECENCGRLWVQKHRELDKNLYLSYLPESDIRSVLKSQRD